MSRQNAMDPEGERQAIDHRRSLAERILVQMAAQACESVGRSVWSYDIKSVAKKYADLAVSMAEALEERLNLRRR